MSRRRGIQSRKNFQRRWKAERHRRYRRKLALRRTEKISSSESESLTLTKAENSSCTAKENPSNILIENSTSTLSKFSGKSDNKRRGVQSRKRYHQRWKVEMQRKYRRKLALLTPENISSSESESLTLTKAENSSCTAKEYPSVTVKGNHSITAKANSPVTTEKNTTSTSVKEIKGRQGFFSRLNYHASRQKLSREINRLREEPAQNDICQNDRKLLRLLNSTEVIEDYLETINSDSPNTQSNQMIGPKSTEPPSFFIDTLENIYLNVSYLQRQKIKAFKDHMRMACDCDLPKKLNTRLVEYLCGHACVNRQLFFECSNNCPMGDYCTNKRFQNRQYANLALFLTENKGWGVQTLEFIPKGTFIIEFVGEVLSQEHFHHRVEEYKERNSENFYFMSLKNDEVIDATMKGNISRFINHSCLPNCEIQRWTVDGLIKLGIFATEDILAYNEITFFYQFNSYMPTQKCYCGSSNCKGLIGGNSDSQEINTLENKITTLFSHCQDTGLENVEQVLELSRLMVHVETYQYRNQLLQILKKTTSNECLAEFLHYRGISLLSSWMIDPGGTAPLEFLVEILDVLKILSARKAASPNPILLPSTVQKNPEKSILVQESDSHVSSTSDVKTQSSECIPSDKDVVECIVHNEYEGQVTEIDKIQGECEVESEIKQSNQREADCRTDVCLQAEDSPKQCNSESKEMQIFQKSECVDDKRKRIRESDPSLTVPAKKISKQSERLEAWEKLKSSQNIKKILETFSTKESEVNEISDLLDEALERSKERGEELKSISNLHSPNSSSNNKASTPVEVSSPSLTSKVEAPIVFKPGQTIYIQNQDGILIPQEIPNPEVINNTSQGKRASQDSAIEQQAEIISKEKISSEEESNDLPPNWHQAHDCENRVYYFHLITRKTQWEKPTLEDNEESNEATTKEGLASPENVSKLPPNWQKTRDNNNRVYYYHTITRESQWKPPTWEESESENKKCITTTAPADTSSEVLLNVRDRFRYNVAEYVAHCLDPYTRSVCKVGRIVSRDDFKYLYRKMSNTVFCKEISKSEGIEDPSLNDVTKLKIKDYVKKYMARFGEVYKRICPPNTSN